MLCRILRCMLIFFFFKHKKLDAWILPIMQGYVQSEICQIDNRTFDFILISRRSRERAGKHYLNCNNFFITFWTVFNTYTFKVYDNNVEELMKMVPWQILLKQSKYFQ